MLDPAALHPSLWRGAQLARWHSPCTATGHATLSAQLPGGGWPQGALTELLVQQAGIGEISLLQPALAGAAHRVVLLQPPHAPQGMAWLAARQNPDKLLWIKAARTADALWSAEQILRSGSCGALLFWQDRIRPEALRRLHLAAQSGATLFFMLRPLAAEHDASPAPLRLALTPAPAGLRVRIVKRRGPQHEQPLDIVLHPSLPSLHLPSTRHAPVDRPHSPAAAPRSVPADLVG